MLIINVFHCLDDIRALWKIQFADESDLGEEQAYIHLDGFLDDCEGIVLVYKL